LKSDFDIILVDSDPKSKNSSSMECCPNCRKLSSVCIIFYLTLAVVKEKPSS